MRRAALVATLVAFASVAAGAEPSFDDPLCPPNPSFPPTPFSACEWKLRPANDVVIDLASGSQIIFAGRGTGEVDSWAELAPPQALKPWDGAL